MEFNIQLQRYRGKEKSLYLYVSVLILILKTSFLLSARFALFLYVFQCKLYFFTWCRSSIIPNFADVETKMPQTTVTGCPSRNTGNEEKQTSNYRYSNPKNLILKAITKISYHNQSPN